MSKPFSKDTRINHSDYVAPSGFHAFPEPTYRASTVLFDSVDALRSRQWIGRDSYTYGLHGTPTTFTLEAQLASDASWPAYCEQSGLELLRFRDVPAFAQNTTSI